VWAIVIIIVILVIIGLAFVLMYNSLVRRRNQVGQRLEPDRRAAQAPPRPHSQPGERGQGLHELRTGDVEQGHGGPGRGDQRRRRGPQAQAAAENALTGTLKSLFAVVENYPDLKANQNVMSLQEELTATENKISFARQFYNDSVLTYNNKIQTMPSNLIAGMFNFTARQFFQAPEEDRAVPEVKLR